MTERIVTDPSQHGWVEVNGKWMWGGSAGGSIADGDTEGQITTWDGTEWTPEGALVVDAGGNVGIGTDSPQSKLDISADSEPVYIYQTRGTVDPVQQTMGPTGSNSSAVGQVGTRSNHGFRIVTDNTERMKIDTDGNVNITGKLFVNGVEVGGGGGGLWTDNGDGTISYSGTAKAADFIAE